MGDDTPGDVPLRAGESKSESQSSSEGEGPGGPPARPPKPSRSPDDDSDDSDDRPKPSRSPGDDSDDSDDQPLPKPQKNKKKEKKQEQETIGQKKTKTQKTSSDDDRRTDREAAIAFRRVRVLQGGFSSLPQVSVEGGDTSMGAGVDGSDLDGGGEGLESPARICAQSLAGGIATAADFFRATRALQHTRLAHLVERTRLAAPSTDALGAGRRQRRFPTIRNQLGQTALLALVSRAEELSRNLQLDDDTSEAVYSTCSVLLDFGVDVNARDPSRFGRTALFVACEIAMPDLITSLLEAGADPNLTDSTGLTPLHLLCSSRFFTDADKAAPMLLKLLHAGANPHALTGSSKHSLVFVCVQQMIKTVRFKANQNLLANVDKEALRSLFNVLEALLIRSQRSQQALAQDEGMELDEATFADAQDVNRPSMTDYDITIGRLRGVYTSPLGMLVIACVYLQSSQDRSARALLPDLDGAFALRSLLRTARLIIDHGADLTATVYHKTQEGELTESTRGAVLCVDPAFLSSSHHQYSPL
jgi:Ankyrin repeats (3 copies)